MDHRHIRSHSFSLVAIDDIIERGNRKDWVDLRNSAEVDPSISRKILAVCAARANDPHAQRHYLWSLYARRRVA